MNPRASYPELYEVPTGVRVEGILRVPPSKSLTQRFLNLALLSGQRTELQQPLRSEDTDLYLAALAAVGMDVESEGRRIVVSPGRRIAGGGIHCGNNGTMLRFLTGALTTIPGVWTLDGTARLRERPVDPLVEALIELGARIEFLDQPGYAPLRIHGKSLKGGRTVLDAGVSSQFASSVAMAACAATSEVELEVADLTSRPYLELTLDALDAVSARVERTGEDRWRIRPSDLHGGVFEIEADYSAAAYPAAAAALTSGTVVLDGLRQDSKQGDRRFLDLLATMGARLQWLGDGVRVQGTDRLTAVEADLGSMPDQVPTLAAVAPFAVGKTMITNVAHLRFKESDRLAAMTTELSRLGMSIQQTTDGLSIDGSWSDETTVSRTIRVQTYKDHRIAMSLALVGLRRTGVLIEDPGVVVKSYPGFWSDLESLIAP